MFILYLLIWACLACGIVYFFIEWKQGVGFFIALVLSVLLLLPGFLSIRITTGQNGEHRGFVTAVEQSGLIWKNYRVYVKTDNQSSQEDVYCVQEQNKDLVNKLRDVNISRELVTVKYNTYQYLFMTYSNCRGDTIYEVSN